MILKVKKSQSLKGEVKMPASKTHSFRALILGSVADGVSFIRSPKTGNDWNRAVEALKMYGAKIEEVEKNVFRVEGTGGKLKTPADVINVNNSGTMLFFIAGIAAACKGWSVITGDESIRNLRKISKNLFQPLEELGITIISTKGDGMAPFIIKGKVDGGTAHMDGVSCQPVFSILVASALSKRKVNVFVKNPGETAYIDLLLHWFKKAGLKFENVGDSYTHYRFWGNRAPVSFDCRIPLEWSAVPYPLLGAIITPNSEIKVRGMDMDDPYGDKKAISILQKMGASIEIKKGCLTARSSNLKAVEVDMNGLPDQLPTIAVAACFAKGKTVIKNAMTARWKECDRIKAMVTELSKMGAKIMEKKDGLIIDQDGSWKLKAAKIDGHKDHRIVMAFSLAGLRCEGETTIADSEYVDKSFDGFIPGMAKIGARFEVI